MNKKNKNGRLIVIMGAIAIIIVTVCAFNKNTLRYKYYEYSIEKKENRTKKICEERIKFCKSTKIDWEKMVSYGNIEYITRINTGGRFHGKRNDCNAVSWWPGKQIRSTYF